MIIYIIGYGRSGSTALSQAVEKRLNATNLGELKYLYRNDKDDLIHPYWISFKKKNRKLISEHSANLKKHDSLFGFAFDLRKTDYCKTWHLVFQEIGVSVNEDVIIDTSKSTFDSFMRGFKLRSCFNEVLFIQPKRKLISIVRSLYKGKNSSIERGRRISKVKRFLHATLVGIPHLLLTRLFSQIYKIYGLETIEFANLERDLEKFIKNNKLQASDSSNDLPMLYGNRSRNKD